MYINTLALVLRAENYKDNDKMLTLFSRELGKIEVLAKGVKKQASHSMWVAEPFACGELQLYKKGSHYTLAQSQLKENFYEIREDIDRYYCGAYILQSCEKTTVEESPERVLFSLAVNALYALKKGADPYDTALFFAIKQLYAMGQGISLEKCSVCGDAEVTHVDFSGGYALCSQCADRRRDISGEYGLVHFSPAFISTARNMIKSPVKSIIDTVFGADGAETGEFVKNAAHLAGAGDLSALKLLFGK